jgi:glycosyltransferase involved in cell wall biosynthesis
VSWKNSSPDETFYVQHQLDTRHWIINLKILFLCKQFPMNRDLFERPYGRFYYLAKILAEQGHEVHLSLLNYKTESTHDPVLKDHIHWSFYNLGKLNFFGYYRYLDKLIKNIKPDWIAGLSDTYFGILAEYLAKKHKARSLIDAYDNYESYIPWLKPLHLLWRRSLARADLVTAAGPALAELMGKNRTDKPTTVIPMSADPEFKHTLDKTDCRKKLGLPVRKIIVGYCGSLSKNRGILQLFSAFDIVHQCNHEIEFILSGRLPRGIELPPYARWLGYIEDELLPCLTKSLDVLVAINLDSSFGNYSYPVKIYEAMQSRIPVVATSTPPTRWMLDDHEELLVPPGNHEQFAQKILSAISTQEIHYQNTGSWEQGVEKIEKYMLELLTDP